MKQLVAFIVALITAPAVTVISIILLAYISGDLSRNSFSASHVNYIANVSFLYVLSAVFVLPVGLPLFGLMHQAGIERWRWWSVSLLGCFGGILVDLIVHIIFRAWRSFSFNEVGALALMGAPTALAFWLIWRLGEGVSEEN